MKFHTSFKIACGYLLLTALLIGSLYYVYHQTASLARMSDSEETLTARRKITHRLVSQLLEAENIGQNIHFGRWNAYRQYVQSLAEVRQTIAVLDSSFTDSLQKARLDTLSALLEKKRANMEKMVVALRNNPANKIYHQQINLLIQSQDTIVQKPRISRQVIQKDRSYTVEEPRKNFFQRLAAAFHKPTPDTTSVKQTVQILETDTLHQRFNARDTLAHILDSIESNMQQYSRQRRQQLNAQAEKIWLTSIELTQRVTQLLENIENEEQEKLEAENRKAYEVRRKAALTTGVIAASSILLAVVFFIIVWRDITRSNHYRRELEKAKKRAESLLVSREKLMLTVTHDIKAPVGSIIGYTDLLLPHVQEPRARNYLNNIHNSSRHLLTLVSSLLDYHKLEAGKMDVRPVSFCPAELLDTIVQSFLPQARNKGLSLRCETTPETRRTYTGDASRIRQIVENLVSNALKFTKEGGVGIKTKMHGRLCCITVDDTGCGMTPEEQQLVFREFTRLSSAQGEEGVGLGLSITLKLVQLLHGELHLQSTPGKGSSFFITLPLQPAHEGQTTGPAQDAPPRLPETVPPQLRILLVDDDRIQLQLTQAMLQQIQPHGAEWDIVMCHQPDTVPELLGRQHFDLLFTDIQMPAMNGFELLKNIKGPAAPDSHHLPVIAITARSDMQEAFFRQHGFATCLYKPFNQTDLTEAIGKALGTGPRTAAPPRPAASARQEAAGIDFAPLTQFAGDDHEAARKILHVFLQETRQHAEDFRQACARKNKDEACRLAHKLLPTFTLIGAPCVQALQTLDRRRDEREWTERDDAPAAEILQAFGPVISALQARVQ